MRPDVTAGPMFRIERPENTSPAVESSWAGACALSAAAANRTRAERTERRVISGVDSVGKRAYYMPFRPRSTRPARARRAITFGGDPPGPASGIGPRALQHPPQVAVLVRPQSVDPFPEPRPIRRVILVGAWRRR